MGREKRAEEEEGNEKWSKSIYKKQNDRLRSKYIVITLKT